MNENEFLKLALASLINGDKKYYVRCGKADNSYLNYDTIQDGFNLDTKAEIGYWQTKFTIKELIEIVKKDVLCLDWKRVEFEEVKEENGQNENE